MISLKGRETGLFKPVWLADRFFYGLIAGKSMQSYC
jgi:hypothetical protein